MVRVVNSLTNFPSWKPIACQLPKLLIQYTLLQFDVYLTVQHELTIY